MNQTPSPGHSPDHPDTVLAANKRDIPGIDAAQYDAGVTSSRGTAGNTAVQSGVEGFAPKTGGHGMADRSDTTSFDVQPALQRQVDLRRGVEAGQEEGGRMRQPNSGIVGRNDAKKYSAASKPPGRYTQIRQ